MAVAELGPQESSYTRNLGAVYESMVIDGFEVCFDASVPFCAVFDTVWPSL